MYDLYSFKTLRATKNISTYIASAPQNKVIAVETSLTRKIFLL